MSTHQIEAKECNGYKEKLIGLIGQGIETPIYFKTRFGVHTFGMRYPILLLILDSNMRIAHFRVVKPRRVAFWNPKYLNIVEIPLKNGSSHTERKYKIGDKVQLKFIS